MFPVLRIHSLILFIIVVSNSGYVIVTEQQSYRYSVTIRSNNRSTEVEKNLL